LNEEERETRGFNLLRDLASAFTSGSVKNADDIKNRSESLAEIIKIKLEKRKKKARKRAKNPSKKVDTKDQKNRKSPEVVTVVFKEFKKKERQTMS
jgi:hypothetical protein